jgi:hypothetical protein
MKKIIIYSISLFILLTSCTKEPAKIFGCTDPNSSTYNPYATDENGSCKYEGNVTFWFNKNQSMATVTINGQVGYISKYYPSYNPECGSDGCANFTLPIGEYTYTATSTPNNIWSGKIVVSNKKCSRVLLY